jgi:hypothetical protein
VARLDAVASQQKTWEKKKKEANGQVSVTRTPKLSIRCVGRWDFLAAHFSTEMQVVFAMAAIVAGRAPPPGAAAATGAVASSRRTFNQRPAGKVEASGLATDGMRISQPLFCR